MNFYLIKIKNLSIHITVAIILIATVLVGGQLAWAEDNSPTEANKVTIISLAKSEAVSNLDKAANLSGLKSEGSLGTKVGTIINGVLSFIGVVLLVLFIYGGWTWMTAGGNEEKVKQANKILSSAIIGFVLIFLSYALTNFWAKQFFPVYTQPPGIDGGGGLIEPDPLGDIGACITLTSPPSNQASCSNSVLQENCLTPKIFYINFTCDQLCTGINPPYNCP